GQNVGWWGLWGVKVSLQAGEGVGLTRQRRKDQGQGLRMGNGYGYPFAYRGAPDLALLSCLSPPVCSPQRAQATNVRWSSPVQGLDQPDRNRLLPPVFSYLMGLRLTPRRSPSLLSQSSEWRVGHGNRGSAGSGGLGTGSGVRGLLVDGAGAGRAGRPAAPHRVGAAAPPPAAEAVLGLPLFRACGR